VKRVNTPSSPVRERGREREREREVENVFHWKRISCKQNARWQHLSLLKASAFFSLNKKIVVTKYYNFYL